MEASRLKLFLGRDFALLHMFMRSSPSRCHLPVSSTMGAMLWCAKNFLGPLGDVSWRSNTRPSQSSLAGIYSYSDSSVFHHLTFFLISPHKGTNLDFSRWISLLSLLFLACILVHPHSLISTNFSVSASQCRQICLTKMPAAQDRLRPPIGPVAEYHPRIRPAAGTAANGRIIVAYCRRQRKNGAWNHECFLPRENGDQYLNDTWRTT